MSDVVHLIFLRHKNGPRDGIPAAGPTGALEVGGQDGGFFSQFPSEVVLN